MVVSPQSPWKTSMGGALIQSQTKSSPAWPHSSGVWTAVFDEILLGLHLTSQWVFHTLWLLIVSLFPFLLCPVWPLNAGVSQFIAPSFSDTLEVEGITTLQANPFLSMALTILCLWLPNLGFQPQALYPTSGPDFHLAVKLFMWTDCWGLKHRYTRTVACPFLWLVSVCAPSLRKWYNLVTKKTRNLSLLLVI